LFQTPKEVFEKAAQVCTLTRMNSTEASGSSGKSFTLTQWLILAVASIGFLFDTYELLMTPLVGVPAIAELLKLPPNHPTVTEWMGRMLWMTALCGGIFGLIGGWLIDRFGRKRILALSIFAYAFSPFAAAFSTTVPAFVFFRCTTFIGVCVEFIAAITWLAELFPHNREKVLGWTQAFASLGGVLVTSIALWINTHSASLPALSLPEAFNAHAPWRYLLMTGLLPAIPIALMLPFVPESQIWKEKRQAGTLKRPSFGELFAPALRRTTLVTAALSACAYAAAFGALQITTRSVVPGLPELKQQQAQLAPLRGEAAKLNVDLDKVMPSFQQATKEIPGLDNVVAQRAKNRIAFRTAMKAGNSNLVATLTTDFRQLGAKLDELTASRPEAKQSVTNREAILRLLGDNREKQLPLQNAINARGEHVQFWQEMGGLTGRILLAILVVAIASSRALLRCFVIPGLIVLPITYFALYHQSATLFTAGIFACGLLVVAQFSYFGEYLPRAFPLHLRGTGGSFATNVGGRMIGTSAAFLSTNVIAPMFSTRPTADHYAMAAGIVGVSVFALALILSAALPEPKREPAEAR
jgi:MFS family permease